ncbi:MAG: LAGLIDADG family homing endonuclease [archaeon]
MAKTRQELKELLENLESHKGTHTEFISVYIPAGYDVNAVQRQLEAEKSTAKNIKSTSTRKNVTDALEKIVRHLKGLKRTPENGLALFCGNVSQIDSQDDLQLWDVEPPTPLKVRMYRCDKDFVLAPLKEMLEVTEVFGLLLMDRKEATIGLLEGKRIELLQKMTSGVPSKVRAGGQCHPFGTLIQLEDGDIVKIEETHNPLIVKSIKGLNTDNISLESSSIVSKWNVNKQELFKIKTIYPQLIVESSGDHLFFVYESDRIFEKAADELKRGDILLMPERISIKGVRHKINSKKYYNSFMITDSGKDFIKKKRIELNLSQKKLAEIMNSVQTVVSYYEIGRQNAQREFLLRLCKGLEIDFENFITNYTEPLHYRKTRIKLPSELDKRFAQFLGYYLGDGCMEEDRITFFEQREDLALEYKNIYNAYFNIDSSYRFREDKNYHQLRFTSRPLVNLVKSEFPELKKTLNSEIPKKILTSEEEIVAGFLKGFFDAEGYVVQDSVGIASNNKIIIEQALLLLLRFSIISSFQEYDNKKNPYSNNPIFKLQINEKKSLENFKNFIGFTAEDKKRKLDKLIDSKSDKSSVRQILTSGKRIAEIIKEEGYSLRHFSKVSSFFRNKRLMSKQIFKSSILEFIKDNKILFEKLKKIYEYPLLPVKISSIDKRDGNVEMVDIETKNHNFIANGLIVHNSSQRFHRITEGLTRDFYKRIAEEMKKIFFDMPKLRGILIGGPIPTKDEFIDQEYLTTKLREKIISRQDLGYTDEQGLKFLVEASKEVLASQGITKEKKILNNFFETLGEKPEIAIYKEEEIRKALEYGAVDTLILSEVLDKTLSKELRKIAGDIGSNIEMVSTETTEGDQFFKLSGMGALLRYRL